MNIKSQIVLSSGVYYVSVDLEANGLTHEEASAIHRHGEPVIQCGGSFSYGVGQTYELPAQDLRFPSQFPAKQQFSLEDFEAASDMALGWREAIKQRLDTAVTALRNKAVANIGHEVVNIDTTD